MANSRLPSCPHLYINGAIQADGPGCAAILKPSPDVAKSGWIKKGRRSEGSNDKTEISLCPQCAAAQRE